VREEPSAAKPTGARPGGGLSEESEEFGVDLFGVGPAQAVRGALEADALAAGLLRERWLGGDDVGEGAGPLVLGGGRFEPGRHRVAGDHSIASGALSAWVRPLKPVNP
jgi:hypothetical protein